MRIICWISIMFFEGYDEDRIFSLIGIAGVNLAGNEWMDKTYGSGNRSWCAGSFRINRSVVTRTSPQCVVKEICRRSRSRSIRNQLRRVEFFGLTYHTIDHCGTSERTDSQAITSQTICLWLRNRCANVLEIRRIWKPWFFRSAGFCFYR